MTLRFGFEHNGKSIEVVGTYGFAVNEGFLVTTLVDGAERMLHSASSDDQSGLKVEEFINVASEAELILRLQTAYPGMTGFSPHNA